MFELVNMKVPFKIIDIFPVAEVELRRLLPASLQAVSLSLTSSELFKLRTVN